MCQSHDDRLLAKVPANGNIYYSGFLNEKEKIRLELKIEKEKQIRTALQTEEERKAWQSLIPKMKEDFQEEIKRRVDEEQKRAQILIQKAKEEYQKQKTQEQLKQELQAKSWSTCQHQTH